MSFKANSVLVRQLTDMGYDKNTVTRALYNTGNCDVAIALDWILDNQDKPNINAPFTEVSQGDSDDDMPPEIAAMQAYLDDTDFYKMVVVVNTELSMGIGKVSSQVAHGAIGTYKAMKNQHTRFGEAILQWEQFGETVIVLKGKHAQHLLDLERQAERNGLCHHLVQDAGKTEVTPGSITALGIFGKNNVVDKVTGELIPMD